MGKECLLREPSRTALNSGVKLRYLSRDPTPIGSGMSSLTRDPTRGRYLHVTRDPARGRYQHVTEVLFEELRGAPSSCKTSSTETVMRY